MYVAATVPYILLTVLLIRGATLEGAKEGLLYYVVPKWERLASPSGNYLLSVVKLKCHQLTYFQNLVWINRDNDAMKTGRIVLAN